MPVFELPSRSRGLRQGNFRFLESLGSNGLRASSLPADQLFFLEDELPQDHLMLIHHLTIASAVHQRLDVGGMLLALRTVASMLCWEV